MPMIHPSGGTRYLSGYDTSPIRRHSRNRHNIAGKSSKPTKSKRSSGMKKRNYTRTSGTKKRKYTRQSTGNKKRQMKRTSGMKKKRY